MGGSLEDKLKDAISSSVNIAGAEEEEVQSYELQSRRDDSGRPKRKDKEAIDRRIAHIIEKLDYLKKMHPFSPNFLGNDLTYPKKKRFIFRLRRVPDLGDLREQVNQFAESKKITNPRKKINQYMKLNPYHAELRALKGIQIFNDTAQSGLDKSKLDVLRQSVKETGGALYNGGISIFNTTWFIRIYLKFLETLQARMSSEYNSMSTNFHWQVRNASDELHRMLLQVSSMISVKKHLNGLAMLNTKMKGSTYTYESISQEEVQEASVAMVKGSTKTFGSGKTANYIIWVIITLCSLFARIPVFKKLVIDTMANIPDISRELTLQKIMVSTVARVTEYQLTLAEGELDKIRQLAYNLYQRCQDTIDQHMNNIAFLHKSYEIDPYLKAAWIVKESEGLFDKHQYQEMMEKALQLLNVVIANSGQVKGSYEFARQLQNDIQITMTKYTTPSFAALEDDDDDI